MADRAAAELQHDILAQIGEQLVHLPGMDAAGGDRHQLLSLAQCCSKNMPCSSRIGL